MTVTRPHTNSTHAGRALVALVALLLLAAATPASLGQTEASVLRDYYSANGLLNRGMYDLAATEYLKFLGEHPAHEKAAVARYGLAVSCYRLQRFREAADQAARLDGLDGFEYAAEASMIRGQSLLALHEYGAAAEQFRGVAQQHAGHDLADDAAALSAEALFRDGRHEAAVEAARLLVRDWPDSPARERTELFRGLAEMASGHFPEAAERFGLIMQRYPDGAFADRAALLLAQSLHRSDELDAAGRQYQRVIERGNDAYTPDARYGLGVILHQQDRLDEANKVLATFGAEHGDHALAHKAALQRAQVLYDLGAFDRAGDLLVELDKNAESRSAETAYWLAKCEMRQDSPKAAAKRLEKAAKAFPESDLLPEMTYDRAVALIRAGADDTAMEVLRTFRSQFPANELAAHALHLMAASAHQRKDYDQSQAMCAEFAREHEGHELSADVAFLAAENTYLEGEHEAAASAYERFLRTYADDERADQARFRLGTALYRTGHRQEAEKYLMSVIDGESPREFASAYLSLGDIHFQRGGWNAAEEYLSRYLELVDGEAGADDALLKLGLALQRQDRPHEALATYERLLDRFPESPQRLHAMFERGQALLKLEEHEAAADAFGVLLDEKRDSRFSSYAMSHLGAIATRDQDHEGAARLYEEAANTAPNEKVAAEALYQAGVSWMAARDFGRAHAAFSTVVDDHGKHVRAAESYARRAVATARLDDFDKALKQIDRTLKQHGDTLDTELVMLLNYERAWCLRERGDEAAAAKAYRAVLAAPRDSAVTPHALLELAEIEEKAERYPQALALLQELEARSVPVPDDVAEQAAYRAGYCLFRLGDHEKAAKHFATFIEAYPRSSLLASASLFCGESLFARGEHRLAAEHLQRVVEHHQDDAAFAPSLLRLGECQSAMQHWSRSEDVFQLYLDRVEKGDLWYQAQFGIGWARENQGRYNEAIDAYTVLLDKHEGPTAARAQFQIGECLYAMGQHEEAVRELLKVDILYAYPQWSAAALYEAGRCFEELSDPVQARSQYEQVTARHADTEWASLAERRLVALAATTLPGHGGPSDRESDTR